MLLDVNGLIGRKGPVFYCKNSPMIHRATPESAEADSNFRTPPNLPGHFRAHPWALDAYYSLGHTSLSVFLDHRR